jgi:hypothetical protein
VWAGIVQSVQRLTADWTVQGAPVTAIFSAFFQTGPGAHPASRTVGTGSLS